MLYSGCLNGWVYLNLNWKIKKSNNEAVIELEYGKMRVGGRNRTLRSGRSAYDEMGYEGQAPASYEGESNGTPIDNECPGKL